MKKFRTRLGYTIIIFLFIIGLVSCTPTFEPDERILINQLGYLPDASKVILVKNYSGPYILTDSERKKIIQEGEANVLGTWKHSGEKYSEIDLSTVSQPGIYYLTLDGTRYSHPIRIDTDFLENAYSAALKSYYYNRSGFKIDSIFGSKWARQAGHPDTSIIVHASVKNASIEAGTRISSSGGWYDAGDYNKYIVNSAISVYTLLLAYDQYKDVLKNIDIDIPESSNGITDILDEVVYNVRWMLTMQDKDGGVFHKLTTLNFEDFVMPDRAVNDRYVVMKTSPATLGFSASMAACARIVKDVEQYRTLADSCAEAAINAWKWASKNPDMFYEQSKDIKTGEYNDTSLTDEWSWAGVELSLLTGKKEYMKDREPYNLPNELSTPSWDLVHTLGLISIVTNQESFPTDIKEFASKEFLQFVNKLTEIYATSPARVSLDYFKWGSNSDVANQAMLGFLAYKISGMNKYLEMAFANIDYLYGKNPTGYCYVTGSGQKSPLFIHHRPSGADNIAEPIPGFLVGGPNTVALADCGDTIKRSTYPALSYTDSECSYSTNEITINWNAPYVFVLAAMIDFEAEK